MAFLSTLLVIAVPYVTAVFLAPRVRANLLNLVLLDCLALSGIVVVIVRLIA
jgi:hypothetical protein